MDFTFWDYIGMGQLIAFVTSILICSCICVYDLISCAIADYQLKKALKTKERIRIASLKLE